MVNPTVTHRKVSGKPQGADPTRVYGNHWDDAHVVTGLENVPNVDATNASNLSSGTVPAARMPALTGDVTMAIGTTATTLAAGNAGNLNSGTLLAARMPALTGDVTTVAGNVATTIANNAVTNAKAAQMAANTIKGNNTAGTANAADLTVAQTVALLGMPFGARLAKTALYTVAIGDDGSTIALGGAAFYALTFPTASTLNATHKNVIVNEDATRAKNIVITGGTNFFLYPGQTAIVYNDNNVWKVFRNNRWRLTGAVTLNVDVTNGNDTNDGLASGAGNALATIQKAWDTAADNFDLAGQSLTIQLADGTYTAGLLSGKSMLGAANFGSVVIKGNTATPANVLFNTALAGVGVFEFGAGTSGGAVQVQIQDMELRNSGASGNGINAWGPGVFVWFQNIRFGATTSAHISAQHGAIIMGTSINYAVTGNAAIHALAQTTGQIYVHGSTITYSNTPAFSIANFYANALGNIFAGGMVFTNGGTVTGPRFKVGENSNIDVAGGGDNYFPGNSAGIKQSGGNYDGGSPALTNLTNSLGADVLMNNTANYFDGPSVAQGTAGTWLVSGTVSILDTAIAVTMAVKLWDGTTVIASASATTGGANFVQAVSLSGVITSPAGNLRISCKDAGAATGKILFNNSGNSKDSTITAVRIQ